MKKRFFAHIRYAGLLAALALCIAGSLGAARANNSLQAAVVDFYNCTEFAGIALVPYANARPLVPDQYTVLQDEGSNASLVVRVAHCQSLVINGKAAGSATVAQVGISILAPDAPEALPGLQIDNYTLYYDTDNQALAKTLRDAGVDARYVAHIEYTVRQSAGTFTIDVPPPSKARYHVEGSLLTSPFPTSFVANWWSGSGVGGTVKMDSKFPNITFGFELAPTVMTVDHNSPLRALIGGSTTTFAGLDTFNTCSEAHMVVTPR